MVNYINPLDRLADFRTKLASVVPASETAQTESAWRSQMVGDQVRTAPRASSQTTISPTQLQIRNSLQNTRDASARQHQLKLSAIQNSIARQRASQAAYGGSYSGGGPYSGQGLVGPYKLIPGAANALSAMMADYKKQTGKNLPILWGGRTNEEQARLYALYKAGKGNLAAPPGKSQHNFGRAVDFGGANSTTSVVFNWLQRNAGRYGFKWTGKNFSQVEPWHWEWFG